MEDKTFGHFSISRKLKDSWLHPSQEGRKFTKYEAWIWLIENARFACSEPRLVSEKLIIIPRGYLTITIDLLSNVFKWNERTVEKFLQLLQKDNMINRYKINPKSKRSYTLLKVNNYNDYQPEITEQCTSKYKTKCALNCVLKYRLNKNGNKKGNKKDNDNFIDIPFKEIKNSFNEICSDIQIKDITPKRKTKVATRWKEQPDLNYWIEIFKKVQDSDFLKGKNDRNWKCSFDWIFENDTNYIKIDEGKYSNKNDRKEVKEDDITAQYNFHG